MTFMLLRALKHKNFRLFFFGQSVSLMGTWMQQVAMSWLAYRLTHSAWMLGLVGFSTQIPTFFIAPFAGVLVDRWTRRKVVLLTQALSLLQALTLTFLVLTHQVSIGWILTLSVLLGFLNAFDVPARQSFLIEMIGKREDLGNAIALNSSMFNVARLVGPLLAGLLIAAGGEALCFFLNAVSYLAVILAISAMKIPAKKKTAHSPPILQQLREGFVYVSSFTPVRRILLLLAIAGFMGMPYTVLMPVFAKEVLGGGPQTLGFLVASTGAGALSGAVYLASRKNVRGLLMRLSAASLIFGAALTAFSFSRSFWPSMGFLFLAGFGMMVQTIASNTILQTLVDDSMRGRVMSFFTVALMGMTPFGHLLAGFLASRAGGPQTLVFGGLACLLSTLWFLSRLPSTRRLVREVYLRKGVISG